MGWVLVSSWQAAARSLARQAAVLQTRERAKSGQLETHVIARRRRLNDQATNAASFYTHQLLLSRKTAAPVSAEPKVGRVKHP